MSDARTVIANALGKDIAPTADAILAALAEAGLVIVPREPTEKMLDAYDNKLEPRSDLSSFNREEAMRAALLWLADNGSEEISKRLCRIFYRIPSTDPVPMPLIDGMTDALKEAIRAAAGGE